MSVTDVLSRKAGVIVGDDVLRLFEYAREKQFAIPAIVRIRLAFSLLPPKETAICESFRLADKNSPVERHLFLHRRRCPRGRP